MALSHKCIVSINVFHSIIICSHIYSADHIEIISGRDGALLFFKHREGPWCPTLKLLHKCKCFLSNVVIRFMGIFFCKCYGQIGGHDSF